MPTQKELDQLEQAKATFKEIMKVHMREPFDDKEFAIFFGNAIVFPRIRAFLKRQIQR